MDKNSKIYVAGHRGLVGSAITRNLQEKGFSNLIFKTFEELDLRDFSDTEKFFKDNTPEYVFLAAAKVGGILANNEYPADFIYDNLQVQNNVIYLAHKYGVKKLLFLGSSCIYPKMAPQPMKEEHLLTGKLEPTNEPYAIAKIAGIKMCQSFNRQYGTNFIAVMPTNLYGINDNFDPETSHVLPALIRKFHDAKIKNEDTITIWGSGEPKREFLHVDDMADGCVFMMENFNPTKEQNENGEVFLNLGSGEEISIFELARLIKNVVKYKGEISNDLSKPDGTPRKLMDSSKLFELGWHPKISLQEGITSTYQWYLDQYKDD